jgi:hypothetical protein
LNPFRRKPRQVETPPAPPAPAAQTEPKPPVRDRLRADAILGNLLAEPDGVWAYYALTDLPVTLVKTDTSKLNFAAYTARLADLAGHRIHLHSLPEEFPWVQWAADLDRRIPKPLVSTAPGAPTKHTRLAAAQQAIADSGAHTHHAYIGVRLSEERVKTRQELLALTSDTPLTDKQARLEQTRVALRSVTATVAKKGMQAVPLEERQLALLIHATLSTGLPVPANYINHAGYGWEGDDIDAFTSTVVANANPYAKSVRVKALRDGQEHSAHVAVLTVERFPTDRKSWEADAPLPWVAFARSLDARVAYSAILDVHPGRDLLADAEWTRRHMSGFERDLLVNDADPDDEHLAAIGDSRRIYNELKSPDRRVSVRLTGPHHFTVFAETDQKLAETVKYVTTEFADQQDMGLAYEYGQYPRWRSFLPGEPQHHAHHSQMPAYYAATGAPHARTTVGSLTAAPLLGFTCASSNEVVTFDPTEGPRLRKSGVILHIGGNGNGKSTTDNKLLVQTAERGRRAIKYDPTGATQKLLQLPSVQGHTHHFDVSSARRGTVVPTVLVPTPQRRDYDSDEDHVAAVDAALAERTTLTIDSLAGLLHPQMLADNSSIHGIIEGAVVKEGCEYGQNPWDYVRAIKGGATKGLRYELHAALSAAAMQAAAVMFPAQSAPEVRYQAQMDQLLTVVTAKNYTAPPPNLARSAWSREDLLADTILKLVARYTQRAMYLDRDPKYISLDELRMFGGSANSGSGLIRFLTRAENDTRKWGTGLSLQMQHAKHAAALSETISNVLGAAFLYGHESYEAATDTLKTVNLPVNQGLENGLLDLESGEVLLVDFIRRTGKVKVTFEDMPDVLALSDTNPVETLSDLIVAPAAVDLRKLVAAGVR